MIRISLCTPDRHDEKESDMEHQPKHPTGKGPADWFTGDVWIDIIAQGHSDNAFSVASVRFAPGARTAWHSHSVAQTLYVTEGEGRIQSRGEPVVALRPGQVVTAEAGEWHWHGADPDQFMTNLAVSEGDPTWGEHVTDTDYQADPK